MFLFFLIIYFINNKSTASSTIRIMEDQEPENVKYFTCLSSTITNDARCTREIKSRIAMVKAAFNKKSIFNSKLEANLGGGD